MGIVAAVSNTSPSFSVEIIAQGEALATVCLIISLSLYLLISDSRYWGRWASSSLDACISPLLVTFAAIVVSKIT